MPDADIIIYDPKNLKIITIISIKVTLRERIAQTGYWKLKLSQSKVTDHIKVFFFTPDEDNVLSISNPPKKGRAIVETDTDGCYIFSKHKIQESQKVKIFNKFINDLKELLND